MSASSFDQNQVRYVTSFTDLVSTSFYDKINAICWRRQLAGDFTEIVQKIRFDGDMTEVDTETLLSLRLSEGGKLAREIILKDLQLLEEHGALPVLNLIGSYERDNTHPFFPTDVYSFHVDRSPVPADTFLCTYFGDPSEIIPNSQAEQKILVPEIRAELRKLHSGTDESFESFLAEHFFDLHYRTKPGALPISLGTGSLWRLATDHPGSKVPPCIHRAPEEKSGKKRLLLIC